MAFKPVAEDFKNDFDLIPAGVVAKAIILAAQDKTSQRGGTYIKLRVSIDEGEYEGRQLFNNINTDVPGNEKATQIGRRELAALCKAVGLEEGFEDAGELVDRYFTLKTTINPAKGAYEESNGFRVVFNAKEAAKNDVKKAYVQSMADDVVEGSKAKPASKTKPIVAVDEDDIPF
jgi:hypothetical protein